MSPVSLLAPAAPVALSKFLAVRATARPVPFQFLKPPLARRIRFQCLV